MRNSIEIYMDRRNQWRWSLRSRNGHVIADGGEGYSTKSNARRAARRVGGALILARVVDVTRTYTNGDYRG
jgi:uncharacterized protein YegP (UPF0339 family)